MSRAFLKAFKKEADRLFCCPNDKKKEFLFSANCVILQMIPCSSGIRTEGSCMFLSFLTRPFDPDTVISGKACLCRLVIRI